MSLRLLSSLAPLSAMILAAAGARAQLAVPALPSSARLLDGFESTAGWSAHPSDGVSLAISMDSSGTHGRAMRLDFDFHGHGGYAIARRKFDFALPENYAFSYRIRGQAPAENFEVKLIDSTGDNVWWNNAVNVHFPEEWTAVTLKKRHITFAWGPRGGGELGTLAAIELSITAGSGGKGTVWLEALTFTPLADRSHPLVLTCDDPACPVDRTNLVWRAAQRLWDAAGRDGAWPISTGRPSRAHF